MSGSFDYAGRTKKWKSNNNESQSLSTKGENDTNYNYFVNSYYKQNLIENKGDIQQNRKYGRSREKKKMKKIRLRATLLKIWYKEVNFYRLQRHLPEQYSSRRKVGR